MHIKSTQNNNPAQLFSAKTIIDSSSTVSIENESRFFGIHILVVEKSWHLVNEIYLEYFFCVVVPFPHIKIIVWLLFYNKRTRLLLILVNFHASCSFDIDNEFFFGIEPFRYCWTFFSRKLTLFIGSIVFKKGEIFKVFNLKVSL